MKRTSYNKSQMKVVLLEGIHPNAKNMFEADGYTHVECYEKALPPEQLATVLKNARFIGIRSRTQLTEQILEAAPNLLAIGCFCIGTNQVDLEAAEKRGVPVFNAPFANTRSVAELVVAEMVMLMRGIPEKNAAAHRHQWLKSAANAYEVRGKTVAIIGYGHIGSQVGVLAEALGMRVRFFDIANKLALGNAVRCQSFEEAVNGAEIVTFHVPATPETRHMVNAETLAMMKPGVAIINASRGHVIDVAALVDALKSGHVRGAAIDVFPKEPTSNQEPFESPLCEFDNVLLTPHIGGSTQEAQANIGIEVAEKLIAYSNTGTTTGAVNFPQVGLPQQENAFRILHIHHNQPGVLSQINELFSKRDINIVGQYLQTSKHIGYVVTDIDRQSDESILHDLKAVPGTIRARILY
ncbi:MAG: phosphoglycerate dehydrogenase [Gammaproteobacteria bacterium]|nr:MAG: phosphoglycerate dehydrogenase [Gammaproteobacteria bacterium]